MSLSQLYTRYCNRSIGGLDLPGALLALADHGVLAGTEVRAAAARLDELLGTEEGQAGRPITLASLHNCQAVLLKLQAAGPATVTPRSREYEQRQRLHSAFEAAGSGAMIPIEAYLALLASAGIASSAVQMVCTLQRHTSSFPTILPSCLTLMPALVAPDAPRCLVQNRIVLLPHLLLAVLRRTLWWRSPLSSPTADG